MSFVTFEGKVCNILWYWINTYSLFLYNFIIAFFNLKVLNFKRSDVSLWKLVKNKLIGFYMMATSCST